MILGLIPDNLKFVEDKVIPPNVKRFLQWSHRKPEPGASRGAGESSLSVESRCPRLEAVRRGKPLQPTRPAKVFAPPGNAATLRSPHAGSVAPAICNLAPIRPSLSLPLLRGRGTAPRWMRCQPGRRILQ